MLEYRATTKQACYIWMRCSQPCIWAGRICFFGGIHFWVGRYEIALLNNLQTIRDLLLQDVLKYTCWSGEERKIWPHRVPNWSIYIFTEPKGQVHQTKIKYTYDHSEICVLVIRRENSHDSPLFNICFSC